MRTTAVHHLLVSRMRLIAATGGVLLLAAACSSNHHNSRAGASMVANQSSLSNQSTSAPAASSTAATLAPTTPAPVRTSSTVPASTAAVPSTVGSGTVGSSQAPAAPSSTPAPATVPTTRLVLRPVTAHGTAAPGYHVQSNIGTVADCTDASVEASRAAVDDNILYCSPSALGGTACWPGPTARLTLCLANPTRKNLLEYTLDKAWAPAAHPARPMPIWLTLTNGTQCILRNGGAWASLDGHPNLYGSYDCGSVVVWAPANSSGINTSGSLWRVQVAPVDGHGPLVTVTVKTAYFVGNAS